MHYSDILKRDIIEKERKKMRIKNYKNVRKGYDNLIILSLFKIAYGVNLLRWHFDDLQYAVYSWCSLNISMLS